MAKKRTKKEIKNVCFRNKIEFGWSAHIETLSMYDGSKIHSEVFKNIFYGHNALRPSCYECPFKSIVHPGDITIGDYWGISKAAPEFSNSDDKKGVSIVLINTELGVELFENIKDKLIFQKTKIEDSLQQPLIAPFTKPHTREQFWDDFKTKNFTYIAKKYGNYGKINKLKDLSKKIRGKVKRFLR